MGDPIREQEIPPFSEKPEYKPQWPVDDQLIQYMQEAYAFMNKPWYQKSQLHDTWYPDAFKRKYPESDFNLDIEGLRADG
ncbi:MAG: hypothetical protein OEY79_04725, partial [Anaplasmataceae bacterium]|nr:hypothetical protein [Anaplasmataceae bacterium]